jgi:hypothetical protein
VHSQATTFDGFTKQSVTIKNTHPVAVQVEVLLRTRPKQKGEGFMQKRGQWVWRGTVPANGERVITYENAE